MMTDQLTIQNWLTRNAQTRGTKTALVFQDERWTYARYDQEVNRLCHAFQAAGVKKGDVVVTLLSNSIEILEVYWACAKLGAIAAPMSPLLRGNGLVSLLTDAEPAIVVVNADTAPHLAAVLSDLPKIQKSQVWATCDESVGGFTDYHAKKNAQPTLQPVVDRVRGEDAFNIMYTSGTTGAPKGIVISHAARVMYGATFSNAFRITSDSVILQTGSLVFNGAFINLLAAMYHGATYVLSSAFHPDELISQIQKEHVTHITLVPSQIVDCLQDPKFDRESLPSLRSLMTVGAPLPLAQKREVMRRLPETFCELYGLTEGFATVLDKTQAPGKMESVGCALPCFEMRIADENGKTKAPGEIGEILGRSPIQMSGYHRKPELTAETIRDGWIHTGDLGYMDEDGFLFLSGRKKDLIITGGVNVYPIDIEQVVVQHPEVREAAVFGVPSKEWGETPLAAVVLKASASVDSLRLKEWINSRVDARYQKVHDVMICDGLPRNVAGKVLKQQLQAMHQSRPGQ